MTTNSGNTNLRVDCGFAVDVITDLEKTFYICGGLDKK